MATVRRSKGQAWMAMVAEALTSEALEVDIALGAVRDELDRQTVKFGVQDLPQYHPHENAPDARVRYAYHADWHEHQNDLRATRGKLSWDGILLEEVYEALAESADKDPEKYETELIQVAASAIRLWVANRRKRQAPQR